MKLVTTIILFMLATALFAQADPVNDKIPAHIHLTTINDNMLKGLLLEVKDTSLIIYPGKFKEWKKGAKYKPVEFGYPNIRELALKRKMSSLKKYYINGSKPLFNEFQKTTK